MSGKNDVDTTMCILLSVLMAASVVVGLGAEEPSREDQACLTVWKLEDAAWSRHEDYYCDEPQDLALATVAPKLDGRVGWTFNPRRKKEYTDDGRVSADTTYTYDDDNRLVQMKTTVFEWCADGEETESSSSYTFTYDGDRRWSGEIGRHSTGEDSKMEIEYEDLDMTWRQFRRSDFQTWDLVFSYYSEGDLKGKLKGSISYPWDDFNERRREWGKRQEYSYNRRGLLAAETIEENLIDQNARPKKNKMKRIEHFYDFKDRIQRTTETGWDLPSPLVYVYEYPRTRCVQIGAPTQR